jgi:hypothetical protein
MLTVVFANWTDNRPVTELRCLDRWCGIISGGISNDTSTSDNGPERTVIDLSAGAGGRYYIIEITKP